MKKQSELSEDEQVQVAIRIRPLDAGDIQCKCVEVCGSNHTLNVTSDTEKSAFSFDHVADERCSQQQLYDLMGRGVLSHCLQGYNCSIFSYGQTGAGKTYSILGEELSDESSPLRGLLPRLLTDLFCRLRTTVTTFSVKCSYLEIYNEQIYDLLAGDGKALPVRENLPRGVYADNTQEPEVYDYEQALEVLLRGVKNRRIAATYMNRESSRSHTIFTVWVRQEHCQDAVTHTRHARLNIVDLAGSERLKQTHAEGDRLREGCNINKSLHVLGNVINCLLESTRKKKHIPYRDSKLTHLLKDSLAGNSIIRLLANVQPHRLYLSDTLSTLMFAKRLKNLRLNVSINESASQNFEMLRQEIRRLREELNSAKYLKEEEVRQIKTDSVGSADRIYLDTELDIKEQRSLAIFQENQKTYRVLIELYEDHMNNCKLNRTLTRHTQWKNTQKKNANLLKLMRQTPCFAKIFHENMLLRRQLHKEEEHSKKMAKPFCPRVLQANTQRSQHEVSSRQELKTVINQYENLLKEVTRKFDIAMRQFEGINEELLREIKLKDEHIKDMNRKKEHLFDLEAIQNQNQYLKMHVLHLQNQIKIMEMDLLRSRPRKQKDLRCSLNVICRQEFDDTRSLRQSILKVDQYSGNDHILQRLQIIQQQLLRERKQTEQDQMYYLDIIDKLKIEIVKLVKSNQLIKNIQKDNNNKGLLDQMNLVLTLQKNKGINFDCATQENSILIQKRESNRVSSETDLQQMISSLHNKNPDMEKQFHCEANKSLEVASQIMKLYHKYSTEITYLRQKLEQSREQIQQYKHQIKNLSKTHEESLQHSQSFQKKTLINNFVRETNASNYLPPKPLLECKKLPLPKNKKDSSIQRNQEPLSKAPLMNVQKARSQKALWFKSKQQIKN